MRKSAKLRECGWLPRSAPKIMHRKVSKVMLAHWNNPVVASRITPCCRATTRWRQAWSNKQRRLWKPCCGARNIYLGLGLESSKQRILHKMKGRAAWKTANSRWLIKLLFVQFLLPTEGEDTETWKHAKRRERQGGRGKNIPRHFCICVRLQDFAVSQRQSLFPLWRFYSKQRFSFAWTILSFTATLHEHGMRTSILLSIAIMRDFMFHCTWFLSSLDLSSKLSQVHHAQNA